MSQEYTSDVQAIDALAAKYQVLRKEIAKVIVGQDEVVKALTCEHYFRSTGSGVQEDPVHSGPDAIRHHGYGDPGRRPPFQI